MRRLALLALAGTTIFTACDTPTQDTNASTVGILATGCGPSANAGSGVVVGVPGQIVTVAHTVAGATTITIVDAAGVEWPAQLMVLDASADLAVLSVPGLNAPPLATGDVAIGAATAHRWSLDTGVSGQAVNVTTRLAITIDDIYGEQSAERSGIKISGDIEVGDSGGPVVAKDGTVMGIVYARSRTRASTGFATDATEIRRVLALTSDDPTSIGRCI